MHCGRDHPGFRQLAAGLSLLAATGLLALAGAAEPVIGVGVDRPQVAEGEVITLTVTLEGFSRRASDPQIAVPEGFDVYDAGRSTNISWVNGKFSSSTTHAFQLHAHRAGTYTLPPITVEDKGRGYRSAPVELVVTKAATAPPADSAPHEDVQPGREGRGTGLFARLVADKTEVYLDEQITLRFRLYQRADVQLAEISGFTPPTVEGFWREDLGPQRNFNDRIGGELYQVREIAWALFPTAAGERVIDPGRVVCHVSRHTRGRRGVFDDFFSRGMFDYQQVPLTTEALPITVKPLPEENRPDGFTGSVGAYSIEAHFDAPEGRQGEPLALIVTVRGAGHIQTIGEPDWPPWDGLRVYDSGEATSVNKQGDRVAGEKTFTQILIPTRSGRIALSPIDFTFFDPRTERYRTVSTGPLQLEVLAAAPATGGIGASEVVALGDDILYIQTGLLPDLRRERGDAPPGGYLVHLIPVGLVVAAAWLRSRRVALERDPVRARRAIAWKHARRRLELADGAAPAARVAADLGEVLAKYLSDWLDLEARGLRRRQLRGALAEAGISEALRGKVLALLEWTEEVRFGAGSPRDAGRQIGACRALIEALECELRASPLGAGW